MKQLDEAIGHFKAFSQEVRWFFDSALDIEGEVAAWFFKDRAPYGDKGVKGELEWPGKWRDDRYLIIPGSADMGLKWREGQLQIKGRESSLGIQRFGDGIEGHTERWIKWSYQGDPIDRRFKDWFPPELGAAPGVVLVEKKRVQRRIRLNPVEGASEVPAGKPIDCAGADRALDVELARICIDGSQEDTHWSLGFEAFPTGAAMHEEFTDVVAAFLEEFPALPLGKEQSKSYPAWLLEISGNHSERR